MASASEDIVDRLVAQGVGSAGVTLFSDRLPNQPDTALFVRKMGGMKAARAFGENIPPIATFPDAQIIVRGITVPARDALIDVVRTALDFKTWTGTSGKLYFSELQYEPIDLGQDENQRTQTSLVFRLIQR